MLLAVAPALGGGRRRIGPVIAASLGALVLTAAAIASPSARTHGGADHGHAEEAADGHAHDDPAGGVGDLGFAALANGQMGDHSHDGSGATAVAEPSIDSADVGALSEQLALTAPLVAAYPTLADAEAAGYRQAGPFSPGLGIHYNPPTYSSTNGDGVMDAEDIANAILIYDGIEDDARLAGFMYMAYQETEPDGFVGDLDRWHYHTAVCVVFGPDGIDTPFGADLTGITPEMCEAEGGTFLDFTGYMVHVWTVPGYESELGVFSDLNPALDLSGRHLRSHPDRGDRRRRHHLPRQRGVATSGWVATGVVIEGRVVEEAVVEPAPGTTALLGGGDALGGGLDVVDVEVSGLLAGDHSPVLLVIGCHGVGMRSAVSGQPSAKTPLTSKNTERLSEPPEPLTRYIAISIAATPVGCPRCLATCVRYVMNSCTAEGAASTDLCAGHTTATRLPLPKFTEVPVGAPWAQVTHGWPDAIAGAIDQRLRGPLMYGAFGPRPELRRGERTRGWHCPIPLTSAATRAAPWASARRVRKTSERRGHSVARMTHISVEGRTFSVSESVEAVTRALGNDGRGVFKDADHPKESIVIDLAGLGWARVSEEPRQTRRRHRERFPPASELEPAVTGRLILLRGLVGAGKTTLAKQGMPISPAKISRTHGCWTRYSAKDAPPVHEKGPGAHAPGPFSPWSVH